MGILAIGFFLTAAVYSGVGFGGGSTYSALLSFTHLDYTQIPLISLLCNLVVVSGSLLMIRGQKLLVWKSIFPLVLFSIPFSFIGGSLAVSRNHFFLVLGISLLCAASLMFFFKKNEEMLEKSDERPFLFSGIGMGLGFLSGIAGIGGGIFLAPILYLLKWGSPRFIAATATFFIFVNSLAGFVGQIFKLNHANFGRPLDGLSLVFAVFLGGQIGSRMAFQFFSPLVLKRVTSALVLVAGIRLVLRALE